MDDIMDNCGHKSYELKFVDSHVTTRQRCAPQHKICIIQCNLLPRGRDQIFCAAQTLQACEGLRGGGVFKASR